MKNARRLGAEISDGPLGSTISDNREQKKEEKKKRPEVSCTAQRDLMKVMTR